MSLTDIDIAQQTKMLPIQQIAQKLKLDENQIEYYGNYKAKINFQEIKENRNGKVVLVTAINPTAAGEGKTTTVVGLGDAMNALGHQTMIALREPSLGPVFGIKGGAAGGGKAQVVPMEDINLHFTGDFHAIGAANNLLAALIDNHIYHGNALNIDSSRISWMRAVDMNDRQLRQIVSGLGKQSDGRVRKDGFEITVASEIMAILCLATDLIDLKQKLGNIIIGYTHDYEPVTAHDLEAENAMTVLLKDAIKPNLVQTLENNPVLIHGGPFANIAHGCNSVIATQTGTKLADYVVTEAGFGGDLGAEKFIDIKCRKSNIRPSAVVVVATIRALKMHGGMNKNELNVENLDDLKKGLPNLLKHLENMKEVFGIPSIVAINKFPTDTDAELDLIREECLRIGAKVSLSDVWAQGSEGALDLAKQVVELTQQESQLSFAYQETDSIADKINLVVQKVYGGRKAIISSEAKRQMQKITELGFSNLPICMAKTQYSFSDNPKLLGRPEGFDLKVSSVKLSAGAGFIVVYTGNIMTMPGLPKKPSSAHIDIDVNGKIKGLF